MINVAPRGAGHAKEDDTPSPAWNEELTDKKKSFEI
jgi:hypothetical protein